MIFYSEQLY